MVNAPGWNKILDGVHDFIEVGLKLGYVALLLATAWLVVAAGLWLVC